MVETIIKSVISFVISGALGYCISVIKDYKKKQGATNEALVTLLQNQLTNTYYVYESVGKIPDYVYKNWLNSLKIYEKLGGDDYVHTLADKMKNWEFIKTDILD